MRRVVVLAWRLQRWEIAAVTLASAAISLGWLAAAAELDAVHEECLRIGPTVAPCGGLRHAGQYFTGASQNLVPIVGSLAAALPFAAGAVLGVSVLSREVEHRTLHLAWPLARSRVRWLEVRLLPVIGLGLLVLIPASLAGEVLMRSFYPLTDPAVNFERYGMRGPLLLARFVPALLLAATVGLLIGRQLPALLVAGALVAGMGVGLGLLRPFGAVPVEQSMRTVDLPTGVGNLYVGLVYRDAEGNLIPEERAWELLAIPEDEVAIAPLTRPRENVLVVHADRYHEVVVREAALLLGATAVMGGGLTWLVRRRRPG